MEIGSGLALRLGFVHPLTPELRSPKFKFGLASGLG